MAPLIFFFVNVCFAVRWAVYHCLPIPTRDDKFVRQLGEAGPPTPVEADSALSQG